MPTGSSVKKLKTPPELRLARFWQKRLKRPALTAFNTLKEMPGHYGSRRSDGLSVEQLREIVADRIARGAPLTEEEYYFAIAFKYLLFQGDHPLGYEEFFTKRWHETATHQGYGKADPKTCPYCLKEKNERDGHNRKQAPR